MQISYKVVGTNGPHDKLLDQTLTGELSEVSWLGSNQYSFIVGETDYDLEIQKTEILEGRTFLFCWLTDDENCGRVILEIQ